MVLSPSPVDVALDLSLVLSLAGALDLSISSAFVVDDFFHQ